MEDSTAIVVNSSERLELPSIVPWRLEGAIVGSSAPLDAVNLGSNSTIEGMPTWSGLRPPIVTVSSYLSGFVDIVWAIAGSRHLNSGAPVLRLRRSRNG